MKHLRVIIAGSRSFTNYDLLSDKSSKIILEILRNNDNISDIEIVSGTARGADELGEQFAEIEGYSAVKYPANWDLFGRRAGYIRNTEMAQYAVNDDSYGVLIAFWDGMSRGTKNMIDIAEEYGLEVHVIEF